MEILKIIFYAVWLIAFISWIVSLVLRIKSKDENMTNYMCIFAIIMLSVSLVKKHLCSWEHMLLVAVVSGHAAALNDN